MGSNPALSAKLTYEERVRKWKNKELKGYVGINSFGIARFVRKYLFIRSSNKCERCGWAHTHPETGEVPLEVHHIDGDIFNSWEDNLQLLCPNCHSLTSTYRARNSGRSKRGYRRKDFVKEEIVSKAHEQEKHRPNKIVKLRCRRICPVCRVRIDDHNDSCKKHVRHETKIIWPKLDKLLVMLEESNYSRLGSQLGISDNAIRKHIRAQQRLRLVYKYGDFV